MLDPPHCDLIWDYMVGGKNNTTKENLPKNKLLFMDTLQVTFGSLWKLTQLEIQVEVNIFVAFVYEGVIIYTDK